MSEENVEVVKRLYRAWGAGNPEEALWLMAPDVVWIAIEDAPDAGTYRGTAGVLAYFGDWLQDFEDLRMDFDELIEAGEFLIAVQRGRARGKRSGVDVDLRYAVVYEFADGRITRVREFRTKEQALEAAGLSE
jgi:uncharacterized protein